MERLCRRAGRGAGRGSRAVTGWFFVVLAAVVTQAVAVWPAAAQHAPSPSGVASDTVLTWGENDFGQLVSCGRNSLNNCRIGGWRVEVGR